MIRVRILSFLTLAFSAICIYYGNLLFHGADEQSLKPVAGFFLAYGGWVFALSSSAIIILSVFSLEAGEDGSFTIRQKSLYGKVFTWLMEDMNKCYGASRQSSYCKVFWRTNSFIVALSVLLFILCLLGYKAYQAGLLITSLIILVFILLIGVIVGVCECADKYKHSEFAERVRESKTVSFFGNALGWTFSLIILGLVFWFLYVNWNTAAILGFFTSAFKIFLKIMLYLIPAVIVIWLAFRFSKTLSKTQFGQNFAYLYKNYLCPRIRLED